MYEEILAIIEEIMSYVSYENGISAMIVIGFFITLKFLGYLLGIFKKLLGITITCPNCGNATRKKYTACKSCGNMIIAIKTMSGYVAPSTKESKDEEDDLFKDLGEMDIEEKTKEEPTKEKNKDMWDDLDEFPDEEELSKDPTGSTSQPPGPASGPSGPPKLN